MSRNKDGGEEVQKLGPVFGAELCKVCEVEKLPIPRVTEDIFTYLEDKGLL